MRFAAERSPLLNYCERTRSEYRLLTPTSAHSSVFSTYRPAVAGHWPACR